MPRIAWASAGLTALLAALALRIYPLAEDGKSSLCFVRRFVGLPCPGCGMTRAFAALAHGDLAAAWHWHPLSPAVAAELFLGWLVWGLWALSGRWLLTRRAVNLTLAGNGVALLVVWFWRLATDSLPW
ncbi:MAG: DUF2752 domain-containing protein [Acidobacteriota bacterium]